jgi:steroid 5-alpha reductase family enzyme
VTMLALIGLAVVVIWMTGLWLISLRLRDASIVDILWGPTFILLNAVYALLTPDGAGARKLLATILVTVWGLRLAIHIYRRNRGKGEDFRYRRWRSQAGDAWWWQSLFKVFLLQGALAWLIAFPLLAAQTSPTPAALSAADWLALVVWVFGFAFEAIGDMQLARFKARKENAGRTLRTGLWKYTRHPNYFGDAVQWWGLFLLAASVGANWAAFSPILMTWLLVRVSGVPMLERSLAQAKPDYAEYMETTSAFFPLPPRRPRR